MQHETPTIKASPRDRVGTRYSRRIRAKGELPAVIYGHKTAPVSVSVNEKEMLTVLRSGTHVINVALEGKADTCLVKELQYGYLGDNVIHVDFARVDLEEEVEVNVHIKFVGTPESAKKPGAVLTHLVAELPVVCKVKAIPAEIRIDLSKMDEQFLAKEIVMPEGVRCTLHPESPVAVISFIQEEAAATGEAADTTATAAEPEVITAKKEEAAPAEE